MRRTYRSNTRPLSAGYTLVELAISVVLVGMIVTIFIATLMNMIGAVNQQKVQLELGQQNQMALDIVERDVRLARSFDTTLAYSTFHDDYGPSRVDEGWTGTWSYKGTGTSDRALILQQVATTAPPYAAARTPVFIQGFVTNVYADADAILNCTAYNQTSAPTGALTFNPKLPYYIVYFVRDGTLYRRTITDTTTARCTSQYQKQSCPAGDTERPTRCIVNDEAIVTNVRSFAVTYYNRDATGAVISFEDSGAYASTDPHILEEVRDLLVTIHLEKTVDQKTGDSELSVRVSRAN